VSEER